MTLFINDLFRWRIGTLIYLWFFFITFLVAAPFLAGAQWSAKVDLASFLLSFHYRLCYEWPRQWSHNYSVFTGKSHGQSYPPPNTTIQHLVLISGSWDMSRTTIDGTERLLCICYIRLIVPYFQLTVHGVLSIPLLILYAAALISWKVLTLGLSGSHISSFCIDSSSFSSMCRILRSSRTSSGSASQRHWRWTTLK